MKFLFYIVLLIFLYRVLFRPKIMIEHRHFYGKKPKEQPQKPKLGEYTDYEEIK